MSEKCLYCNEPIAQKEGKKERKFCSPSHCTMYHLKEKNKDKPKGERGRPKGSKNKFKPSVIDILEAEARKDPLTNAARGRDENGVNNDELEEKIRINNFPENKERIENERNMVLPQSSVPNPVTTDECYIPCFDVTPESYNEKEINKEVLDEISMFGTVSTKTELVNGKVNIKVVDKKQIVNDKPQMPKGLSLSQQLEWREKNLK